MTNFVYSAKNNCFIEASRVEEYKSFGWELDDVKLVENSVYEEFIEDRASHGYVRVAGEDGLPVWGDVPPPTREEMIIASKRTKEEKLMRANSVINNNQWPSKLTLKRLSAGEKEKFVQWLDYLDAVSATDAEQENPEWPAEPEL